ncbi:MAG: T9SS type A sorting domain-containing protein [Bacteroidales bacterium]|jgi:hypothetical protein|nr:T9SS type A sorting domain-containing protein [Bacteroidales bacterium]
MKHLKPMMLLVIVVSCSLAGFSQELPRHVFCSGGDHYQTATVQLSWTIGQDEPLAANHQPTVILCSGFQQFDDQLVSVRETEDDHQITLYPNPCKDFVRLDASFDQNTSIAYTLYDLHGRALQKDRFSNKKLYREEISLSEFSPGIYNLMIIIGDGENAQLKSIKIIRN